MATKKHSVALVNMRDGSVQGHKGNCADLKRGRNKHADEPWVLDVATKLEAWEAYNADFIAEAEDMGEDPHDYAWPIEWLPCADHVPSGVKEEKAAPKLDVNDPAINRLLYLVAQSDQETFFTTGGVERTKTAKRRERELAVAEEVVRFAFDHAGITGGYLAPTGLYMALLDIARGKA